MRKVYARLVHLLLTTFLMLGSVDAQVTPVPAVRDQQFVQQDQLPSNAKLMVSVARLRHKISAKALAAYSRGWKHAQTGDWTLGALEFQKAVAMDPEYADAHGNLGAVYIHLYRFDDAAEELRRASELDPYSSGHHANLAIVFVQFQRYKDAENEAMSALALDSTSVTAHYLLGVLLANKPSEREKAIPHLEFAARFISDSRRALVELYERMGQPERAVEQRRFLAGANMSRGHGSTR